MSKLIVGFVLGLSASAWAATSGPLWHWTVQKNGEIVCITPYVWAGAKIIECGD